MNKLDILFNNKKENLLSVYFTAGYPRLSDTAEIISELENNQVDLMEIGIPFSDPIADGPVIQHSNSAALENGMTLKLLFNQLKSIKGDSTVPRVMMGYFNPVFRFGMEDFCKACESAGIDGVIIPDLPLKEFELNYKTLFDRFGIHFIFLVTPQTSKYRLEQIDKLSNCFVYAVSTNSTTGGTADFSHQQEYFNRLKENLNHPFLIGFGVQDKESFDFACQYASGAIVGSAFIRELSKTGGLKNNIKRFIHHLKIEQNDCAVKE